MDIGTRRFRGAACHASKTRGTPRQRVTTITRGARVARGRGAAQAARPLPTPEAAQTPGGVKSPCPEGKIKQRMENRMPRRGYALDGYFFYV